MFGKILRGVGTVTKIAGPALAGLGVGGPIGAIVTVSGQVAGALTKKKGQQVEAAPTGPAGPTHKLAAPVAATGVPVAVMTILKMFDVEMPAEQVQILLAMIAPFVHQIGHGAAQAGVARS